MGRCDLGSCSSELAWSLVIWLVHNDDEVSYWYGDDNARSRAVMERVVVDGRARQPAASWYQIYALLPAKRPPDLEPVRHAAWGHGYASEIGRASLALAFDVLDVQAVVSCTVRHNAIHL